MEFIVYRPKYLDAGFESKRVMTMLRKVSENGAISTGAKGLFLQIASLPTGTELTEEYFGNIDIFTSWDQIQGYIVELIEAKLLRIKPV